MGKLLGVNKAVKDLYRYHFKPRPMSANDSKNKTEVDETATGSYRRPVSESVSVMQSDEERRMERTGIAPDYVGHEPKISTRNRQLIRYHHWPRIKDYGNRKLPPSYPGQQPDPETSETV